MRAVFLRVCRLSDQQLMKRVLEICEKEAVPHTDAGIEAILFTASGDMRQAVNNLQSTYAGFGMVNPDNVFKVCDQPHPLLVKEMVKAVLAQDIRRAYEGMQELWFLGYSPIDIITTLFRVVKQYDMPEYLKLEFIKQIGFMHVRVVDGCSSLLQFSGLLAKLCKSAAMKE